MAGALIVAPRARIFHGHDWVYATEVRSVIGSPEPGAVVQLRDVKNRLLGSAMYNPQSQIVARRFSRQVQDLDLDFFTRRIRQSIEYRDRRGMTGDCRRLVWSESDGLPGLVADQFANCVVVQTLTLAMDQRKQIIADAFNEIFQGRDICLVERNDAPVRRAEGMETITGILRGALPEDGLVPVEMDGVKFGLDPLRGQKTGFYLDQAAAYRSVAAEAKGRSVLDCFANQGAFGLFCARAGAASVRCVESGAESIAQGRAHAARNGLEIHWTEANVFDFLKHEERRGAEYGLIVLDPPSFTKTKGSIAEALRGYKALHLRALRLLRPGGILATFSCSHHIGTDIFLEMISEAVVDAKSSLRILQRLPQAPDHPVSLTLPESEYLRGFLFEVMPGR